MLEMLDAMSPVEEINGQSHVVREYPAHCRHWLYCLNCTEKDAGLYTNYCVSNPQLPLPFPSES